MGRGLVTAARRACFVMAAAVRDRRVIKFDETRQSTAFHLRLGKQVTVRAEGRDYHFSLFTTKSETTLLVGRARLIGCENVALMVKQGSEARLDNLKVAWGADGQVTVTVSDTLVTPESPRAAGSRPVESFFWGFPNTLPGVSPRASGAGPVGRKADGEARVFVREADGEVRPGFWATLFGLGVPRK